ncbi:MAG TPA: DUF4350 domain-containing protein [Acidimicrobiales bacterium]|nr:DUF4350 domain-containing protein [Acidimicrobiales bacterium]
MTDTRSSDRSLLERWQSLSRTARAGVVVVSILLVANAAVALVSNATAGYVPSGPQSSSLATGDTGYEAWARLLSQYGHHAIGRLTQTIDDSDVPTSDTLVIADPRTLSAGESQTVEDHLRSGGSVVTAGVSTAPLLAFLLGSGAPKWDSTPAFDETTLGSHPETAGVEEVVTSGLGGSWSTTGDSTPILGPSGDGQFGSTTAASGDYLATVTTVGAGRLGMIADSSVFANDDIASKDNAQFGLDVVGAGGVVFDENAHGYGGGARGFAGLPIRWQWGLAVGLLAVLVWMWSRGRRMGPAELVGRPLPPARRAYVDALATGLARSRPRSEVVEPVRTRLRFLVASRAGVRAEDEDEILARRAEQSGVPEAVVAATLRDVQTDEDVLALGRALATMEGSRS